MVRGMWSKTFQFHRTVGFLSDVVEPWTKRVRSLATSEVGYLWQPHVTIQRPTTNQSQCTSNTGNRTSKTMAHTEHLGIWVLLLSGILAFLNQSHSALLPENLFQVCFFKGWENVTHCQLHAWSAHDKSPLYVGARTVALPTDCHIWVGLWQRVRHLSDACLWVPAVLPSFTTPVSVTPSGKRLDCVALRWVPVPRRWLQSNVPPLDPLRTLCRTDDRNWHLRV